MHPSRDVPTSARLSNPAAAALPAAATGGLAAVLAAALGLVVASASADIVDLPRFPALSPDGQEIVFSWRGDLWRVFARGGPAVRLTSHPQDDLAAAWSPDGRLVAFESDRDGFRNLFVMNPDGSGLRQVTELDRGASLAGFGVDAAGAPTLTFTATLEPDQFRSPRPYQVGLDGGQPARLHDAFGSAPAVSPDGRRVLFERGGSAWSRRHYRGPDNRDVWLFDRADGTFRHLTAWDGNDGQPRWLAPDEALFLSDRPGPGEEARPDSASVVNLWRMNVARGDATATRLTTFADDVVSYDVSADGRTVVLAVWNALHTLDLATPGATPRRLEIGAAADQRDAIELRDVARNVSEAQLSPDGKTLATVAFGDVYVRAVEDKSPTRAVTRTEARERQIAWSPDGVTLYFVTDEAGQDEIRAATVAATRGELRAAARVAALADGAAGAEPAAGPAEPATKPDEPATKPDEAATRPAAAAAGRDGPSANDPRRWADAVRFDVRSVASSPAGARVPSPSPDGKRLAFRRGNSALVVRELAGGEEKVLVETWDPDLSWQWSPDGRHIAFATFDRNFNSDISIVPADGSAPAVNVTRHPDNDLRPRWSADGKILAFLSERINNESDVWMVYLDKEIEALTPVELEKYHKDAADAARKRKPLGAGPDPGRRGGSGGAKAEGKAGDAQGADEEGKAESPPGDDAAAKDADAKPSDRRSDAPPKPLDLADAYLRLKRVTTSPGAEGNLEITPGGDRIVFSASDDGGGLFSVKWDGTDRKKLGPVGSVQQVTLTGDRLVAVTGGRAGTLVPAGGEQKFLDIESTIAIDRRRFAERRFLELARTLGERFYHPTMKGLDWPALTARYLELARAARTADEFNFVGQRFLGELDASHLGVTAPEPPAPIRQPQGRIGGAVHMIERDGQVDPPATVAQVDAVFADSPAARAIPPMMPGDVITAVEFEPFAPRETLDQRLRGRIGKETALTVRRAGAPGAAPAEFTVLLTPISWEGQRRLAYEDWLRRTREAISAWSGGRIGYIHIESMNQQELDQFERDLFAAADGRKGLVIDVRNNGGGWTADRLLTSITARPHAHTLARGMDPAIVDAYPQDRLFIQRYAQPMNMLCNEKSFSNAEIIAHAFRTLGRGTLVGQQTYGGVISTDAFTLLDGTTVRLPFRGWYLPDGRDMERNGAKPDLVVPQTPEAEAKGDDPQLRAAVEDLLRRLDPATGAGRNGRPTPRRRWPPGRRPGSRACAGRRASTSPRRPSWSWGTRA